MGHTCLGVRLSGPQHRPTVPLAAAGPQYLCCLWAQWPLRPPSAPEAHPLAWGHTLGSRGEFPPRGCRGEASVALRSQPEVFDSTPADRPGGASGAAVSSLSTSR
eukprot:scaffold117131_cov48-Phaeocystis_antarctica.AAC.3